MKKLTTGLTHFFHYPWRHTTPAVRAITSLPTCREGGGGCSVGWLRHERVGGQPRLIVISPQAAGQQTVPIKTSCFCCQHYEVWLWAQYLQTASAVAISNEVAARLLAGAILKWTLLWCRQTLKLSKRNKFLNTRNMINRGWFREQEFQIIIINSVLLSCLWM
jgi:hypothetical protein